MSKVPLLKDKIIASALGSDTNPEDPIFILFAGEKDYDGFIKWNSQSLTIAEAEELISDLQEAIMEVGY